MMPEVDTSEYDGVWIFVEQHDGDVAGVSWELLNEARKLADEKGDELVGLVMGAKEDVDGIAEETIAHGADRVLVAADGVFEPYRADPYGTQFRALVEERKPDI
ncbi:MAG: electron transfer flavoprotein subunit alpha, partial [Halobacteria archaeon]|nr:electron transfer flavoprotein subunit alpha [Halobacteria archaeon]